MNPLTKSPSAQSVEDFCKQLRERQIPSPYSAGFIQCPRCKSLTSNLVKPSKNTFRFRCINEYEDCYAKWRSREEGYKALDFACREALSWKTNHSRKMGTGTRHYHFTPTCMTLLDRKRNLRAYIAATELFLRRGHQIPSLKLVKSHCSVGDSTAPLIVDTLCNAMQPRLIPPKVPSGTKWHLDCRTFSLNSFNVQLVVILKLEGIVFRTTTSHWKKLHPTNKKKAEQKRGKIQYAKKFDRRSVRLAYYPDNDLPKLGSLHTYFYGDSKRCFHVLPDKNVFPINSIYDLQLTRRYPSLESLIDVDKPTGFAYFSFDKGWYKPQKGTDRYEAIKDHLDDEYSRLQTAWRTSGNDDKNFGRFLCTYMYFRNHELTGTTPTTEDLCEQLITPRSAHELNLRLTLRPGEGAPPVKRDLKE